MTKYYSEKNSIVLSGRFPYSGQGFNLFVNSIEVDSYIDRHGEEHKFGQCQTFKYVSKCQARYNVMMTGHRTGILLKYDNENKCIVEDTREVYNETPGSFKDIVTWIRYDIIYPVDDSEETRACDMVNDNAKLGEPFDTVEDHGEFINWIPSINQLVVTEGSKEIYILSDIDAYLSEFVLTIADNSRKERSSRFKLEEVISVPMNTVRPFVVRSKIALIDQAMTETLRKPVVKNF